MILSREEQIKFAIKLLPLLEQADDATNLEKLYELTELFKSWVETDDNSVAYDLSEYAYESLEILKGKADTGWRDEALKSLKEQLQ